MTRTDIINYLIEKHNLKSYLEIGIYDGSNFQQINCQDKTGVDPMKISPAVTYKMTSDEFFAQNKKKFDLIFIDGSHYAEQVYRDIENALKALDTKGFIVLHDCSPPTQLHAAIPRTQEIAEWNGDVYKAVIKFRSKYEPFYRFRCADTDWGVGIINKKKSRGKAHIFSDTSIENISWEFFDQNREGCLNLITPEQFKALYNGT